MTCECGHTKAQHIYEEGACRPGYQCACYCEKFEPAQADHAYDPSCGCQRCSEIGGDVQPNTTQPTRWYLMYTQSCSMKVKTFETRVQAERFAGAFMLEHLDAQDDNSIDALFEGTLHALHESFGPVL